MTNIVWGATKKPVSSQRLADFFAMYSKEFGGELFIGYPIIAAPDGSYPIDALWISPERGVVLFNLIEGREVDVDSYKHTQDESANRLETRLRSHTGLMRRRALLATPTVVTYAPAATEIARDDDYPIHNDDTLADYIRSLEWDHSELFARVLSVIQSISTIRKGRRTRSTPNADTKGGKLKVLESSIAHLDEVQNKAVIETVDGVQRIRGLAGSGKTIILALKAAYLHAQRPDWKIAVTFNTRSLKAQFRRLINTFVIEQTGYEPDWGQIQVLNAWGAPGGAERSGLYYQFVRTHGLEYVDFRAARSKYGYEDAFSGACASALSEAKEAKSIFDAILIDEAQDFDSPFFQMCYAMLAPPKRLVYAYDELQSLTDTSLPPPEELFGKRPNGDPVVQFDAPEAGRPQQDLILEKCYRNSRPVLATAHALGFGIYREPDKKTGTGLIQMFDQKNLWLDVGYRVVSGALNDGERVRLARHPGTSPKFLEEHSSNDDLIQFHKFASREEQAEWVVKEIEKNLTEDELEPDDIMVINPDPVKTRKESGLIRSLLMDRKIDSHLVGVDASGDEFFDIQNESIAFTGIFRAKGNEAGMVYVVNAQDCADSFGSLTTVRNQLFTAITRSKAWVRVAGVGEAMDELMAEYQRVVENEFALDFIYPDERVRKTMRVVNRDMTAAEKAAARESTSNIKKLLDSVESGEMRMEDLPEKDLQRLRRLLGRLDD